MNNKGKKNQRIRDGRPRKRGERDRTIIKRGTMNKRMKREYTKRDAGSTVTLYSRVSRHQLQEEVICSVYSSNCYVERELKTRGKGRKKELFI